MSIIGPLVIGALITVGGLSLVVYGISSLYDAKAELTEATIGVAYACGYSAGANVLPEEPFCVEYRSFAVEHGFATANAP